MPLEVVPFSAAHLDAAATLLAARHRRDRRRHAVLPPRFEQPAEVRALLGAAFAGEGVVGFVALRGGRMVGYLLGAPESIDSTHPFSVFDRLRSATIPITGHAIVPGLAADVYPTLYAALAAHWIAAGLDVHYIRIPSGDRAARATWFALGFAADATLAVRDTTPLRSPGPAMHVRQATSADVGVLAEQAEAILAGLSAPPTFLPPLPDRARSALQAVIAELLDEPTVPQWVAIRDGEVAGMQVFDGTAAYVAELVVPDRAIYLLGAYTMPAAGGHGVGASLLDRSLEWARDAGYAWCFLDYLPANPAGARFWQRHGFQPLVDRLCRQLDERVCQDRSGTRST